MRFALLVLGFLCVLTMARPAVVHADEQMQIHGAGATFPYLIYTWWALRYGVENAGTQIAYEGIGSGGGIKRIEGREVDFGASDAPLSQAELDKYGLVQFPMVLGGVVPVINLPGIEPGTLKLTGPLLADMFMGRVSSWDDPAIAALNPDLTLPKLPISVVHRKKGSGTTWIFTNYLSKVSDVWKTQIGTGKVVEWPVGEAAIGNEAVNERVRQLPGGLGYCEYAYVVQTRSNYALLQNSAGNFVKPNRLSFQAAAAGANWSGSGEEIVLTDKPGQNTWPISGATFILMYKQQQNPEMARNILHFFDWAYRKGGYYAELIDFVGLSNEVSNGIRRKWTESFRGPDGEVIWSSDSVASR